MRYMYQKTNVWFVTHYEDVFVGGGGGKASFWASENYTRRVDFESHSPEWQVLSKFSFQHCENLCNPMIKSHCHVTCDMEKVSRNITLEIQNKKTNTNVVSK